MPATDEETIGSRSLGRRCRHRLAEPPAERRSPERDLAPAFEDSGNRTSDDAIGEAPASQFVGDLQAAGAPPQQEILGAALGESGVVDIAALGEPHHGRGHDPGIDPARRQVRCDLGARPGRPRQERDGGRERRLAGVGRRCCGLRTGRS